jgi:peptide/nickel transport system permease protein
VDEPFVEPVGAALVRRRFFHHRGAVAGLVLFVVLVLAGWVGGALWHDSPGAVSAPPSQHPTWSHPMGTDEDGHDLLALVLQGVRHSVSVSVVTAIAAAAVGAAVGIAAGRRRGATDRGAVFAADVMLSLPLLAAVAVIARRVQDSRGSWVLVALGIAAFTWMPVARTARIELLELRDRDASVPPGREHRRVERALGALVLLDAVTIVAVAVLAEAALAYLGFGVGVSDTSLGLLIADGQPALATEPWLFWFPGLVTVLLVLSPRLVAEGLRDSLGRDRHGPRVLP